MSCLEFIIQMNGDSLKDEVLSKMARDMYEEIDSYYRGETNSCNVNNWIYLPTVIEEFKCLASDEVLLECAIGCYEQDRYYIEAKETEEKEKCYKCDGTG